MTLLLAVQGFLPTIVLGFHELVAYWPFLPYLDFNNLLMLDLNRNFNNAVVSVALASWINRVPFVPFQVP
jgi:hypothetical protein